MCLLPSALNYVVDYGPYLPKKKAPNSLTSMKAVCWHGTNDVRSIQYPIPNLNPRDAIIKITSTAICGSDLHLYDGYNPTMKSGDILGHEFMWRLSTGQRKHE